MNVLVTGATGFIGQHVVPKLLEAGHTVTAISRDDSKARHFGWFPDVRFIPMDVHRETETNMIHCEGFDAAIHLAWPGLPNYKHSFHFEKNLPADYEFLKSLVLHGVRHLVVAGTCLEYGMQSGPLAESTPTAPCTAYGLAKDALRKFLESTREALPFTLQWTRLFYLHGPGQHSGSLLAQLDQAIDRDDPVFNMSGGEQLRDYLPVEDAARSLVSLVQHPRCSGVINICSGVPTSVRRLVEDHMKKRGSRIRLNIGHYPYTDYEPMAYWGRVGRLSALCSL
jgi:dTDP-6-deoxy-L-talose 4-dehydrogenase (NAD+)